MAENGEEKLIAVARHIAKTLGHTDNNMADDILQIFSNFDGRFREKLTTTADHSRTSAALDHNLKSLDRHICRYISSENPIWSDSADAAAFLDTVDELVALIREWTPMAAADKAVTACLHRAEDLLQQCMFRLEDEFRSLMERGGELTGEVENFIDSEAEADEDEDDYEGVDVDIPVAKPISGYDIVIDAIPAGTINDLQEITKRMVAAGYGKECCHVYSTCRRDFLEESLSRLGLHKLSIDEVKRMPWSELEDEIEKWTKAVNVAVRILFPSERRLCDRVYFGFDSAADLSFMEVCRGSTIQLLNLADAVAIGSRAPERLFKVLDVFETMRDLIPEFESVFSDQYCLSLRNESVIIWKRLGEAIRGIFMELENLIRRDPVKASVPGGGLHPITRYVMNYLRAVGRSRLTLEQVFDESDVPSTGGDRSLLPSSSLSVQMAWIMELLESNLEAKSKIYRDSALCSVFLMNNGRYIVQKVKDDELGSLLGDDWIRKHTAKVRQYHVNYQRSSWNKILGVLKLDNNTFSNVASKALKDKLKAFNVLFEEICRSQSTWVIFDEQLREELKISVAGHLVPAYRNFLGRFHSLQDIGKYADKHVKYGLEDVEARIDELFRGNGRSGSGRN